MNKKIITYAVLMFIVLIGGLFIISKNRDEAADTNKPSWNEDEVSGDKQEEESEDKQEEESDDKSEEVSDDKKEQFVSGYSFETTKKNVISKEYDGDYLNSFITVAQEQEEFLVNLKGIDSSSKIFIINPDNGDTIPVEYSDGEFSISVNLDKDINYGIIIDYSLSGAIRVVEDLNTINNEQLVKEILMSMGCGL